MARTDVVEVFKDTAGEWRWRRKAANGQVVGNSAEGYGRRSKAVRAANRELDPKHLLCARLEVPDL